MPSRAPAPSLRHCAFLGALVGSLARPSAAGSPTGSAARGSRWHASSPWASAPSACSARRWPRAHADPASPRHRSSPCFLVLFVSPHRHRQRLDLPDDPGDLRPASPRRRRREATTPSRQAAARHRHRLRGRRVRRLPHPARLRLAPWIDDPARSSPAFLRLRRCFYVAAAWPSPGRSTSAAAVRRGRRPEPICDAPDDRHPLPLLRAAVRHARCTGRRRRTGRRSRPRLPHQRGRAVPEGLDRRRAARGTATGSPRRCCATARRRAAAGVAGTRRSTSSPTRLRGLQARARPGRGRGLRRRRPDQREGLPAGQVRAGRAAAPARSTTTAASACRRRPPPGNRAFGVDRGLPFPLADLAAPTRCCCVGSNLAETMPPAVAHLAGCASAAALVVVDPRRTATARLADDGAAAPPAGARHRPRARARAPARAGRRGAASTPTYVAARTTGFDAVRRAVAAVVARAGRAGHRRAGDELATRARRGLLAGAGAAPTCSPAAASSSTARAPTRSRRAINLALALGLPGRQAAATAASPARATARAAGSTARRPTSCPATARSTTRPRAPTSPRSGASTPESLPGPGRSASSCSSARHRRRARGRCWCTAATSSSPRRTPPHVRRAAGARSTCSWSRDFVLSETAALADVVLPVTQWAEEEGTMTNLEGRVLRRRGRSTRRPGCAASWDPAPGWPSGWLRRRVRDRPRAGVRRAGAGPRRAAWPTTPASPTSGSRRRRGAASGRARQPDGEPARRHAAAVPRPLRHPRRPGPVRRGRPPGRRPSSRAADCPVHLVTGRVLAALPVRRPDPPGPRAPGRARAVRRDAPAARRPARRRRRRPGPGHAPAAAR